jgi:hypothetical protein
LAKAIGGDQLQHLLGEGPLEHCQQEAGAAGTGLKDAIGELEKAHQLL